MDQPNKGICTICIYVWLSQANARSCINSSSIKIKYRGTHTLRNIHEATCASNVARAGNSLSPCVRRHPICRLAAHLS